MVDRGLWYTAVKPPTVRLGGWQGRFGRDKDAFSGFPVQAFIAAEYVCILHIVDVNTQSAPNIADILVFCFTRREVDSHSRR